MIWKESNISEISRIGDGAHASLKRIKSGIPYLTAKNITKMGIDYSNMDYISEQTYNKYFRDKSNESSPFLCVNSSFSYIKYVYAAFIFSNVL